MKNKASLNIKVIAGSTREGRFSDKAATWIAEEIKKQKGIAVEVLDLRDYDMPFFNEPMSPSFKQEPYKNEAVARFTKKIEEGDAFVLVTPEYNHGTSGVLKNALDWVYQEWNNKPVAFVSYGSALGTRSVEQLRQVAVELQMAPIRNALHMLNAWEESAPSSCGGPRLSKLRGPQTKLIIDTYGNKISDYLFDANVPLLPDGQGVLCRKGDTVHRL